MMSPQGAHLLQLKSFELKDLLLLSLNDTMYKRNGVIICLKRDSERSRSYLNNSDSQFRLCNLCKTMSKRLGKLEFILDRIFH